MCIIIFVECKEGYMRDADSENCVKCPVGTYCDTPDAASCTSCPEGKTTRSDGTNSASKCVGKKITFSLNFYSIKYNYFDTKILKKNINISLIAS